MFRMLQSRLVMAALVAMVGLSLVSPVLPENAGGGPVRAEHAGDSTC